MIAGTPCASTSWRRFRPSCPSGSYSSSNSLRLHWLPRSVALADPSEGCSATAGHCFRFRDASHRRCHNTRRRGRRSLRGLLPVVHNHSMGGGLVIVEISRPLALRAHGGALGRGLRAHREGKTSRPPSALTVKDQHETNYHPVEGDRKIVSCKGLQQTRRFELERHGFLIFFRPSLLRLQQLAYQHHWLYP